jgi:hypothetical protein
MIFKNTSLSKSFIVCLVITTNSATQCFLLPVSVVIAPDWTLVRTWTYRQLLLRILTHVITIALSFMAGFAKMCVTPAEPLGS